MRKGLRVSRVVYVSLMLVRLVFLNLQKDEIKIILSAYDQ